MSLDALIMLFGALVALLPFLGLPNEWDNILLVVAGVAIVVLGIFVRRRMGSSTSAPRLKEDESGAENATLDLTPHEK